MKISKLLCFLFGHKWEAASKESKKCRRCGQKEFLIYKKLKKNELEGVASVIKITQADTKYGREYRISFSSNTGQ